LALVGKINCNYAGHAFSYCLDQLVGKVGGGGWGARPRLAKAKEGPGKLHPLPARARKVAREGKANPQKRHGPYGMAMKLEKQRTIRDPVKRGGRPVVSLPAMSCWESGEGA